mmetsp:Transcript_24801/g.44586  ORF Transcript_24801/g.44586 Transcript_24801/m.44586 type:complete len:372 (-) Transcript_24801:180-1295(-)|eukprot:CAMPEP_0201882284 /NCGR_PEP_ID=MMETSP0902-20130614/13582_1 /ASSEMBLY_ACC=CAM_ASM_000551 /TAXON_ID=420261 /ORGANISM="Thalassiosira antarctica, Strain CCMP982" /LENGTH=371 /DNA_ID=CAMNT_0048410737 /DNA_START=126 /DNA_END=1241 /DNA_ORIENTATION=+
MSVPTPSFGGLKDFSVDAQRRMFIEQQDRERQADNTRRASRKIKQAMTSSGGAPSGLALSGFMSNLESGGDGVATKRMTVGDDDDDSIADDDWSLDSEESFYVGIERADYAQPNNLEMYGEEKEEDNFELKEDRFGISRVSVAIMNREYRDGKEAEAVVDWDADIPIHNERSSSLHEFMNGTTGGGGTKASRADKDNFVAMPIVGSSLEWNEDSKLGEDDAAIDQVYQHKAAEGKAFIDKIVNAPSETPGKDDASTVADMACPPTTPGLMTPGMTPRTAPGFKSGGWGGNYPVLSPMALFSPGITTPGDKVVEGEDNGVRQMRERELRKDASADAAQKMRDLKKMIASKKDNTGKVDAYEMMKLLEKMMKE